MSVVYQPIFMVLVNPGPLGHFKGSRPNPYLQAQPANAVGKIPHATGKLRGIGRGIFTASVSITQVEMKILVAQSLQMLGQPLCVRQRSALRDLRVKSRPTPPSEQVVCADTAVMQLSNHGAIVIKLGVIVFS